MSQNLPSISSKKAKSLPDAKLKAFKFPHYINVLSISYLCKFDVITIPQPCYKYAHIHVIIMSYPYHIHDIKNLQTLKTLHIGIKALGTLPAITASALIGHSFSTNRNHRNADNHLSLFLIFVVRI